MFSNLCCLFLLNLRLVFQCSTISLGWSEYSNCPFVLTKTTVLRQFTESGLHLVTNDFGFSEVGTRSHLDLTWPDSASLSAHTAMQGVKSIDSNRTNRGLAWNHDVHSFYFLFLPLPQTHLNKELSKFVTWLLVMHFDLSVTKSLPSLVWDFHHLRESPGSSKKKLCTAL